MTANNPSQAQRGMGGEDSARSQPCGEASADAEVFAGRNGWPRLVYQRRWFAWRPVRLNGDGGRWAWLRTVVKTRLTYKAGDYLFEGSVYALLP